MIFLPENVEPKELLNNIRELCWEVSEVFDSYLYHKEINEEFQKKLNIKNFKKGLVTDADIEISELIKNKIQKKYPFTEWDLLSEEDKEINEEFDLKRKWYWIIDPLDGTKDFVNKTGEYAMHLALSYQKKIIIGVVLIPQKEQLWIYFEGKGTWCEDKNSSLINFNCEMNKGLDQLKILTSRSHMHDKFKFLLDELNPLEVKGMGSVGYKIASLLRGEADMYISYSLPKKSCPRDWDMAAPFAIIKGLGGRFTDIYGKDLAFLKDNKYQQRGILVASMNEKHDEICQLIRKIISF